MEQQREQGVGLPGSEPPGGIRTILVLRDGTRIPVRPIGPDDDDALKRFHGRLSARSIYQRFFETMPQLNERLAERFTHVDGYNRQALVALDPNDLGEIISVIRYDREPGTDRAEYAAVVADAWQGKGLGLLLTKELIAEARKNGVRHMYALVLPENQAMIGLLEKLDLPADKHRDGQAIRIDLDLA